MKPNLKLAMERADLTEYGATMLRDAEAAHQAETAFEAAPVHADIARMAEDAAARREQDAAEAAARAAEQAVRDQIEAAKLKQAHAYSRAFAVVADALIEGGHHPRHIPDAAALYQRAIADMLLEIANMPVDRSRQYGAESAPATLARGSAVADALAVI